MFLSKNNGYSLQGHVILMKMLLLPAIEEEEVLQNIHELPDRDKTAAVSPAIRERDVDFVSILTLIHFSCSTH